MINKQDKIIIKHFKKYNQRHFGGSWKIAYADFVTAMMAFFMLMWLLNVISEEQKQGIANYFSPTNNIVNTPSLGNNGALQGEGVSRPTTKKESESPQNEDSNTSYQPNYYTLNFQTNTEKLANGNTSKSQPSKDSKKVLKNEAATDASISSQERLLTPEDEAREGNKKSHDYEYEGVDKHSVSNKIEEIKKLKNEPKPEPIDLFFNKNIRLGLGKGKIADPDLQEQKKLLKAAFDIRNIMKEKPGSKNLMDSVIYEMRPEGLFIQIIDQENKPMFPPGSSIPLYYMRNLMAVVARSIATLQNKMVITGHTGKEPFTDTKDYGNWELSVDRANAVRRLLEKLGVLESRFDYVAGKGATEILMAEAPNAAPNRRITILLKREQFK